MYGFRLLISEYHAHNIPDAVLNSYNLPLISHLLLNKNINQHFAAIKLHFTRNLNCCFNHSAKRAPHTSNYPPQIVSLIRSAHIDVTRCDN